MKIYNLPRGYGKSTRMVYISDFLNVPILVCNKQRAEHIKELAKKYKLNIPEPICIEEIKRDMSKNHGDVLVDEAIDVLHHLLCKENLNMIGCTLSDEDNIKINDIKAFN